MKYPEFKLETYLAKREFVAPYNFCASDVETLSMGEVLGMADQETLDLWKGLSLGYTETRGHPLLRKEIAGQYGVTSEDVLCFAGAEEGIYCAMYALLSSEDHVIVVTPCYQSLEALPHSICSTTKVKLLYEEGWKLNLEKIRNAIQPNTKLVVVNYPHNPTGALLTKQEQKELIEIARQHNLWIFSDEVYRLLELDEKDRLEPMASLYEKGLSLSVMSKAYGMGGLRVGWIVCQDEALIKEMAEVKHYLSICNSAPSEILSLIALKNQEKIISRNRELMLKNIGLLDAFFEENGDLFEWVRPKGGCIGYPLYKGKERIDQFADRLLEKAGVLILPGTIYDDPGNHFRISFGRKNMKECYEILAG